MWLVVGLGNPGSQYSLTRHNIGFMALDVFLKGLSISESAQKEQFKGITAKFKIDDQDVLTIKPQTYMNLSGESVRAAMDFYKIPQNQIIVVHDEVDLPFQGIKIQKNRGAGGHNGIKSISQQLGNNDYIRLRLGVGKPAHPDHNMADYVLGKFTSEEMNQMMSFLGTACEAIEAIIFDGSEKAAMKFNK